MQEIKTPLTDQEKANMQLLEISSGIVKGVTAPDKMIGSLVLPDCVTGICNRAFFECTALTRIVIPKSVTRIGKCAFTGCISLTELTVDSENPVYCSENNIIYTKDKKHLIASAGGLNCVVIPDGVTKIGWRAFSDCTGLTELSVDRRNNVYYSEGNIIYTKDKQHLIAAAGGLKGRIVLPDGITKICRWAFEGCDLTSIVIPGSVTEIDTRAFHGCSNLKTVIIESTIIKHIGETAFANVHTDVHFTVKTDAVKAMLKKNTAILDENITVEPNL